MSKITIIYDENKETDGDLIINNEAVVDMEGILFNIYRYMLKNGSVKVVGSDEKLLIELYCIMTSINYFTTDKEIYAFTKVYSSLKFNKDNFETEYIKVVTDDNKPYSTTSYPATCYGTHSPINYSDKSSEILVTIDRIVSEQGVSYSKVPCVKGIIVYHKEEWRKQYIVVGAVDFGDEYFMYLANTKDPSDVLCSKDTLWGGNPGPTTGVNSPFFKTLRLALAANLRTREENVTFLKNNIDRLEDEITIANSKPSLKNIDF